PGFAQAHGHRIRRIDFEKVVDAPRERRAMQPAAEHLWDENIGHALDVVAGARMALHSNTKRAELLNPSPYLLPRDADFFCDLRAADHDGGVFRQESEQRVDATVRGAGQDGYWSVTHVLESRSIREHWTAHKRTVRGRWRASEVGSAVHG